MKEGEEVTAQSQGQGNTTRLKQCHEHRGALTVYQTLTQIPFHLPSSREKRRNFSQMKPTRHQAPRPPSDHVRLGCLDDACPPPPPRMHFSSFSIFGRLGGGAWEQRWPPPFPFSGHWPFKPAGCQGLSWSDPMGRVWSGTRGPFNCCCRLAAHRLAWVVRGGDWPGPGERETRGLR